MAYRVLPAADAFWRPSNQMGVANTDLAAQLGATELGARMWRLTPGQASTRHRHRRQRELYVLLEGTGRMRVGDALLTLAPLSAVLVDPGEVRQVFNDTAGDQLWLVVGAPPEAANTLAMTEEELRFLYPDGPRALPPELAGPAGAPDEPAPTTVVLLREAADALRAIHDEPLPRAIAAGRVPAAVMTRWAREDAHFVRALRRAVALLVAHAPDEAAIDLISGALPVLAHEIARLQALADEGGGGGDGPHPLTRSFGRMLVDHARAGFADGIVVYWAAEYAYLEAWREIGRRAGPRGRHRDWIENWTSPAFTDFVEGLGRLVDRHADGRRAPQLAAHVFARERDFWRMCWDEGTGQAPGG